MLTAVSVSRECGILPRDAPVALVTVELLKDEPFIKLKPLSVASTTDFVSTLQENAKKPNHYNIENNNPGLLRRELLSDHF